MAPEPTQGEDGASVEDAVREAVATRRERVDAAIPDDLPVEDPETLYEAARQLFDAGGKRLRPGLTLLVAEALTEIDESEIDYRSVPSLDRSDETVDVMAAALSIEVIHSFTLIHDDIMDDDDMRRGVPAVHRSYDEATAILAGDTLYSKAFEIMLRTEAPPERALSALELLAKTCTKICEGQSLDVTFESRDDVSVEEYLDMVERKTAVLYAAAASVPAVLLGADEETVEALYAYGVDVGTAFQIRDDILDLTASSDQIGKSRGSDLVAGKRTLVTLHASEQGVDVDELIDADDVESADPAAIDQAVAEIEAAGSLEFARERARDLARDGEAHLEVLPEGEPREILAGLATFLVERSR
ncbi:MAG: polyprenyl synthetase family protein [Halobacteriaceae archaeon]